MRSTSSIKIFEDSEGQLKKSPKKEQTRLQKAKQSLKFLFLPRSKNTYTNLKHHPKFKNSSRLLNGKPENIIKNRYYRHLRYKWDEILGQEYSFLNESKEKKNLQEILSDTPLFPEYSTIIGKLILEMQKVLSKCLKHTNIEN